MTDNLKILQRVHNKLFMRDTSHRFVAESRNTCDLFLALHVDYSGEVPAVGISLDADQLCDID